MIDTVIKLMILNFKKALLTLLAPIDSPIIAAPADWALIGT